MHRRPRKIRRTGRHTTPSQVEKVAEQAGKAVPAVAIAGVLVAAPAANAATSASAKATTISVQQHRTGGTEALTTEALTKATTTAKVHYAGTGNRSYVVETGDSLASIAHKIYGSYDDWTWIYQANRSHIANPNEIFPGERLVLPSGPQMTSDSAPVRHSTQQHSTHGHKPKHARSGSPATLTSSEIPSGTLSCGGLETLWRDAGGAPAEAETAAAIAMAESGGNQYAHSPTNDFGYWQINGSWGALATYNALGNAKAAVHISADGSNWSPWTTYTSGAYHGRC